jgi:hypothetical protein
MTFAPEQHGERAGLLVFGADYAWIGVERKPTGRVIVLKTCLGAREGGQEQVLATLPAPDRPIRLRVEWRPGGLCRFGASLDGSSFTMFEPVFAARPGGWVGAKVGVFAAGSAGRLPDSRADFAWFRVAPLSR